MKFDIVPEFISCILLALIGVYMLSEKKTSSLKEAVFKITLVVALIANVNKILSTYTIANSVRVTVLFSAYVNTLFYFSIALLTMLLSITTYIIMFESRYEERRLKTMCIIALIYFLIESALIVANLSTGWLFYIDAQKNYHHGVLYAIHIIFLAIAVFNITFVGFLEWKHIKKSFRLILFSLPVIGICIGVLKHFYPDSILMGTITAFSVLSIFISGEQQRGRVDPLTEIPNREAFFNDIARLCFKKKRFRIINVGLQNFKQVNGQFGQRLGDELLLGIAEYFSTFCTHAMVYRTSGVQFTLVVTQPDDEEYEECFKKIIDRFNGSWNSECGPVEMRIRIADIEYPAHGENVDEIIASLEYATRIAKNDPHGKPVRFSQCMKEEFSRRNYVIAQMEKALREDLFFLNIQPVYDIQQQRFTGGEVLLRLTEDNGMPISPAEFIPIAIENGIATKLGLMVMEKVCRFLQENRDVDIGWLSINVSSQQDEFDETVSHLEMLLEQYGIEPQRIKLEITEMVLLEDLERAHTTMDELNKRGIGVYLDDFGTGYSNLVNVMTLPFECVKIDKGFIRGIANNPKSSGMLQTIVSGLKSMNVIALAEGVETEEQDNIVRELNINRIQGYYYARPMPTDEFVWLIRQYCPIESKPTEAN